MSLCYFVSDLHGKIDRYEKLFEAIKKEKPMALFMGGDLLPHSLKKHKFGNRVITDFTTEYLINSFESLKRTMGKGYPAVFVILGNDDARSEEEHFIAHSKKSLWHYIHFRREMYEGYKIFGYSYVPPTPFQIKDWERYDVSRYVDPGCVPPTEGFRTVDPIDDIEYSTIKKDLEKMAGNMPHGKSIFLFHSPPYKTTLDRAALDGITVEHVPLDVHVGSIAIKQFIEDSQPFLTLHGHIHESTRITGQYIEKTGKSIALGAAWDGPELAIIKFDLDNPEDAERELL
ncbi:MAG: hypothetical protein KAG99_00135 [Bacteroidales bacterium]|nr:hypothetical protein [Bacteroidales bacterium]